MTRVEEIIAAMKSGRPMLMFLVGIAAMGREDFDGIYSDLVRASEKVYCDSNFQAQEESDKLILEFFRKWRE